MPRKTIKSLEAQVAELRELNAIKSRREDAILAELSDTKQRLKEMDARGTRLMAEYDWIKRLCQSLSEAIRTRS